MFERFTDRSRRIVVLAQEEARRLNHTYIGTEHLLIGMLHEGGGAAAEALTALGITLDDARAQVQATIGRGEHQPTGHIPFTPRCKKVLELSDREAKQLGHNYIGTEHLLLGLVREGEGVGAQVLVKLGAPLADVRTKVIDVLSGRGNRRSTFPRPVGDVYVFRSDQQDTTSIRSGVWVAMEAIQRDGHDVQVLVLPIPVRRDRGGK